jgi:hypothetical protein
MYSQCTCRVHGCRDLHRNQHGLLLLLQQQQQPGGFELWWYHVDSACIHPSSMSRCRGPAMSPEGDKGEGRWAGTACDVSSAVCDVMYGLQMWLCQHSPSA